MIAALKSNTTLVERWVCLLTPALPAADNKYNDSHGIFIRVGLITLPFTLLYALASYLIGFRIGVMLMLTCLLAILAIMAAFQKTGQYRLCANLYLATCFFIAILGCSVLTGGIDSMVTPWFVLIPTASALLLKNDKDTWYWTALTCLTLGAYYLLSWLGYEFPMLYDENFTEFFNATCIIGLVIILSLIATMFGNSIRQQKQFSDDIINNLPGVFYMLDRRGKIIRVNQHFSVVSGIQTDELCRMTILDFFEGPDKDLITQWLHDAFNNGSARTEAELITKPGNRIPYYFSGGRVRVNNQDCLVGLGTDISERHRIESALLSATKEAKQASHAKSVFLASVSHDLRQPLSALSIIIDALRAELLPDNEKMWLNMRHCVDDLSKMLANLLDLSKLEAGVIVPEVCDFVVEDIVHNTISSYAPRAMANGLALRYRRGNLIGRTDPVLFQRIIRNFISNAVRYTGHGGILIGYRRQQGKHWLEVWDTGIGIPADKISEIFEEFHQISNPERNHAKGSGLGLSIAAKTAAVLGLQIRVQSRLGRGSMFAVEIPPGEEVTPQVPRQYEHRPLRIALVEDNANVAEALTCGLMGMGHQVTHAATLTELLSKLGDAAAPEFVISDYRLAGNENGQDIIAAVQQKFEYPVPGLIITGDTDPRLIQKLSASEIKVLHKPITLEKLKLSMAEIMCARTVPSSSHPDRNSAAT